MGRGYSGNHPRYSRHSDERYDAKEAYNKDLSDSARLHYLENDRHDHDSPAKSHCTPMHNNRADRIRERAVKLSERGGEGQGGYDYENPRVMKMIQKARRIDERSNSEYENEKRNQEMDRMIDERSDSPLDACAKSEGGSGCIKEMGGAWRVISNKTDKPWPAKYASKSKAEAALRGYHAG